MDVKLDGKAFTIREQLIEDPVRGLTFQFEVVPGTSAPYRMRIFGNVPLGNRAILFNDAGAQVGAGTLVAGLCKPAWLGPIDSTT